MRRSIQRYKNAVPPEISGTRKNSKGELGDLLFSVINLCRYLSVDPALALHRTNKKFLKRFS